jgi:hypothetical protein
MARHTRILVVVALVVLAASAAAAQSLLTGGSPGLSGSRPAVAQSPTPGSTPGTTAPGGTTPGTTTPGTTAPPSTGAPTPPAPSTPTPAPTTPSAAVGGGMAVDQIVSLTRVVDAGAPPVSAFTVPAGRLLVITDVLITNTGEAPVCGASITSSAAAVESGTGLLCVPAQSSLNLGLTTGLEFGAGQSVVLANAPTSGGATGGGALHYHLRGFLAVSSSGA